MKLSIFRQPASEEAPYLMSISLVGDVVPPHDSFHVPIYHDEDGYAVEICGFRLEGDDPDDLLRPVATLMDGLVNIAQLPTYVFTASDSLLVYPVYTDDDEVFATTPGGPVFRDVELANVRQRLSDYLHKMELCGWAGHVETLHTRGVNRETLGAVRPSFYLKKRVPGENDFWAPVFRSEDGKTIYTYAASARREVPVDGGCEVMELQNIVANALLEDMRLHDVFDLRPDRLFPESMEAMRSQYEEQPYQVSYKRFDQKKDSDPITVPIYRNAKKYVAFEHRRREDRYNVYIGRDPVDLSERMSLDMQRRGVIGSEDSVELLTL